MRTPATKTPYGILQTGYAHAQGIYGEGITVAVIDTGIFPHRDLQKRIIANADFLQRRKMPYDGNGHGTHIAGIIGSAGIANGHYIGVAPKCSLVSIRILDGNGNGKIEYMLEGIHWILENHKQYHIRIVNISIGALEQVTKERDEKLIRAVESLWDAGLVVIVAAGNRGPEKSSVTAPGTSPKVITVGASDDYNSVYFHRRMRKNYSGRGPTKNCIVKPEIVAPGFNILSCRNSKNGYVTRSGTSMSTPFVSGAIALLLERYPSMTNRDVKLALYQSATDLGLPKEQQGWGLLNIPALLNHEVMARPYYGPAQTSPTL